MSTEKQLIKVAPPAYEKPMQAVRDFTEQEAQAANLALLDAQKLVVKTDEQCKTAMESFVMARDRINALEDNRKSVTGPLNGLVGTINDLFRVPSDKLKQARDLYNKKAVDYKREQEAKREEEERQARLKAEAEERRKREEKEAQERAWREKEAKAKAEAEAAERKAREAKNDKDRAAAEAVAAKARSDAEKAAEKANPRAQEAAEVVVAPEPTKVVEAPKVAGFRSKSVKWYAKVVDPTQVPQNYGGRQLWVIDQKALDALATALKTKDCPIPGVRFYSE